MDAGDEPVHVSVEIVVPNGSAHAVLVGDGGIGYVGEGGAAVVAQHLARAEVPGQQDVGVAVAVDVGEGRREGEFAPVARAGDHTGADRHDVAHVLVAALAVVAPEIAGRRPEPVPGPVPMGEEGVEVAVAVMIGGGHRVDGAVGSGAERGGHFRELPAAVVAERLRSLRVDREEIGDAIAVEVDEVAGPVHRRRRDAAIAGPRLEAAAVPAEEPAGLAGAVGDVEFGPAVAVDIGKGEAAVLPASFAQFPGIFFVAGDLDGVAQADRLGHIGETGTGVRRRNFRINGAGQPGRRHQADETGKDRRDAHAM